MAGSVHMRADGHLVWVTLDHPGKFNAMSRAMWKALKSVFESIQHDAAARCVVVQGVGGHFCAGGDIAEYPSFRFDPEQLQQFHENEVWGGLQAMLDCDVPIVAQIAGNCMGAGVEIASCCDLRLAGVSARFGAPIARLGFPMAPREAALVAQAVGSTTARAMLLAAEVFDAQHMRERDFLTRLLPDAQLAAEVHALAQRVASLAPQAARLNKQTIRALNWPPAPVEYAQAAIKSIAKVMPDTTPIGLSSAYRYASSAEHREGIAAFLGKRPPDF
ncbi:MAG: enoyl-CoA hydratase [Burkholderiales bacterium RIFCSPLOWO2_12_FULL_61_40]|nr:MAG: enoyl-CoA hydratase [Burkholderiales bacterium RIFCSPLOWO2_12_FULL_61_40]